MKLFLHKINVWRVFFSVLICATSFECTTLDKKTALRGIYRTSQYRPHQQLAYAERYGYNSECLVLMEGPVPSRMEPCAIGDRRSGRDMYQETEVEVAGDFFPVEWPVAGYIYGLHVNEGYYYDVILFSSSYQRRNYPWFFGMNSYRNIYGREVVQSNNRYSNPMSPYRFNPAGR
ncbi:hypothetical protein [Leptospira perdikensis]|uniref:Uncharacterized protein n=1 Tax=Leptospira perdikensis TaxID=2484948 RepID=A0A4R9J705_9LEPT|nr:hypothetical protein [Leptospira perdikensis]TGL33518.1 hypothetical protein EHQ49_17985 [Leptospira perdikensis]